MSADVVNAKIVEPYAQALMSLAKQENITDDISNILKEIENLLENSPEFVEFITNPIIKGAEKKSVLKNIMGEGSNSYLVNFLMLLVDKGRIMLLSAIIKQYIILFRKLNQIVLAEVTSTIELSGEQRASVVEKVKSITKAKDVEIKSIIDPDIIGGVIIKVESQILDFSLRKQIRSLSLSLTKVS